MLGDVRVKLKTIINLTKAEVLSGNSGTDLDIKYAFAADLMSDTLFIVSREEEPVLLISGVTNSSVIRTAVILDIPVVLIVRGKNIPDETVQMARENNVILLRTRYIMFVTCGILYNAGMKGAPWKEK